MRQSRATVRQLVVLAAMLASFSGTSHADELPPIPPIKRLLPPPGIEIPADVRAELAAKLDALEPRVEKLTDDQDRPDVEVFTKAVRFALKFDEFYDKKDFEKARWALAQAEERLRFAQKAQSPWSSNTGLVVRGYRSEIDGSVQPFGLVIPEGHDFKKPCPLYVWLHGRGDKQTDLHFLYERAHKVGEISPPGAIVLHPFGRHCLGFKSAGEIDVIDAENFLKESRQYAIDADKVVLMGFSMGGAGAWHIGAHYPDRYAAVLPGAGFAETARYQNLKPSNYPPAYEQSLWGMYDVPRYTRNLFNVPLVIAYSGENDKQIQAARVMEEAFAKEGRKLEHLIGPGMGHQYHPETKQELLSRVERLLSEKRPPRTEVSLQTRTARYAKCDWIAIAGLQTRWEEARVEAKYADRVIRISTSNVASLAIESRKIAPPAKAKLKIVVDDQELMEPPEREGFLAFPGCFALSRVDGRWDIRNGIPLDDNGFPFDDPTSYLHLDRTIARGPIDDAFRRPFMIVLPDRPSKHPRVQQWVEFESRHLIERWEATFRGTPRVKRADEISKQDDNCDLVLFGDPASNSQIAARLKDLPLSWNETELSIGGKSFDAATHVPVLIRPDTKSLRYIVLNSGPTFREAHDRSNSLQNPKLPDWAIVDITTPPDAEKPGKIVAADFFDEAWQVKK